MYTTVQLKLLNVLIKIEYFFIENYYHGLQNASKIIPIRKSKVMKDCRNN